MKNSAQMIVRASAAVTVVSLLAAVASAGTKWFA